MRVCFVVFASFPLEIVSHVCAHCVDPSSQSSVIPWGSTLFFLRMMSIQIDLHLCREQVFSVKLLSLLTCEAMLLCSCHQPSMPCSRGASKRAGSSQKPFFLALTRDDICLVKISAQSWSVPGANINSILEHPVSGHPDTTIKPCAHGSRKYESCV